MEAQFPVQNYIAVAVGVFYCFVTLWSLGVAGKLQEGSQKLTWIIVPGFALYSLLGEVTREVLRIHWSRHAAAQAVGLFAGMVIFAFRHRKELE